MNPFVPQKSLENNVNIIKQKRGFVQSKTRLPKFFLKKWGYFYPSNAHIIKQKRGFVQSKKNDFQFLKMRLLLFIYIVTSGSERTGTGV